MKLLPNLKTSKSNIKSKLLMLTNWLSSNFSSLPRLVIFPLSIPPSFTWFFLGLVIYKLDSVSLQGYSLTFLILFFMFFPYFSLFLSRFFFYFFSHSASAQSAAYKRKGELICFIFYWQMTILPLMSPFASIWRFLLFLLALLSSVHHKSLTIIYSIYFKVPRKILAF